MRKYGILLLVLMFVFYPKVAHAYIDPFTGGYLFQLLYPILAAIIGVLAFFPRLIIRTIKKIGSFFGVAKAEK